MATNTASQYELELARIEERAQKAREDLSRKQSTYTYMESKFPDVWNYKHSLCPQSNSMWVSFEQERYASLSDGKLNPATANFLGDMLKRFPPVPMVKVKDYCTSFKPFIEWEEDQQKRAEKGLPEQDSYDCGGVLLHVNVFQEHTVQFIWESWGLDGEQERAERGRKGLIRIAVKFGFYQLDLGKLYLKANRYGGDGPISSWERCELSVDPKWDAQSVKWASGGREYPNSFEVYWDRDTGATLDYPSMIR